MAVAVILALTGVAASVPLVPRDRELAFIRFKDRLYDTARAELEQRLAEGDLSVPVVRPLAELYLQYADVDSAILLLERFVAEHPDDLAARRMLGTYYQYGQRPYDYLRNLEQIAAREPTATVLRELADTYSWVDEPEKQIQVIERLDARGGAGPQDLIALARLSAARGAYDQAVAALERAGQISHDALDEDGLDLLAALLVDAGRGDEALSRLARRHEVTSSSEVAARLARTLHGKGRPDLAARLLESSIAAGHESETSLAAITQAEVDAGLADRALARLVERDREGTLPAALKSKLVEIAVARGEIDTAWSAGASTGWGSLPPPVLASLVTLAQAKGRTADVQTLVREVGDACLAAAPVLAAQLAIERGDLPAAARWAAAADAAVSRRPEDDPALADIERRTGHADAAYARLRRHLVGGGASPWAIELFAQLALDTRRSTEALPVLARVRTAAGPPADVAWARVATAAGEDQAVLMWLRSPHATRASAQSLRDVAYLALDRGRPELAVAAATRLPSAGAPRADRLLLARAHAEAGHAEVALDLLRPLASRDREASAMYDAALARAATRNAKARTELTERAQAELSKAPVSLDRRAELVGRLVATGAADAALPAMEALVRANADAWLAAYVEQARNAHGSRSAVSFLVRQLARRDLTASSRGAHVRALLDLGATAEALPFLRELATREGDTWVFAYDEALASAGRRAERVELWRGRGTRIALPEADRRAAAFKLLELRDKPGAEQVLRAMASSEAPDGPTVAQLLHLWGPRPPQAALDWLEARARAATGPARAGWLSHLVGTGGAKQALAVLSTTPSASEVALFDAWVSALRATGDRTGLQRAIERAAATSRDARQLASLGQVALAESLPDAAGRAYEAWVAIDPAAQDARRWLGLLAVARNDLVLGKEHLEAYVAAGGRDPEALLRYGELLEHDGRRDAARRAFALGLESSLAADRSTPSSRRTHAFLLAHGGREDAARTDLETLVAEQPADAHLRADYVAWLMKEGRHADAKRILDGR